MRKIGFRTRLAAGYAAILACSFAALGCATYGMVERCLNDNLRQSLLGVAEFERTTWPAAYPAYANATTKVGPCVFFLTSDGGVLYSTVAARPPIGPGNPILSQVTPTNPRFFEDVDTPMGPQRALVTWADRPVKATAQIIEVVMPLGPLQDTLRQVLVAIAAISALATLASVPLGMLMARRALQPLTGVIETARAMDAGSLDRRAPAPDALDELGTLAEVFNRMMGRLQSAFERQRQFAVDASHELRTPLTVLRGEIELALRRPRSPAEYQQTLASAHEEIERLQALADDLLTLARLDSSAAATAKEARPIDLAALVCVVLERMASADADWHYQGPEHGVWVAARAEDLERLVANLLANLAVHAPKASAAIQVSSGASWAQLVVEDDGAGLGAGDTPRLFDRFFRGEEARHRPGAGLGLAIARQIANDAGGQLTAANRQGGGARFELTLPSTNLVAMS